MIENKINSEREERASLCLRGAVCGEVRRTFHRSGVSDLLTESKMPGEMVPEVILYQVMCYSCLEA